MTDKEINIKPIFPNAVTMAALCFGVSSMNMAFWGQWETAIIFIVLSALLDFFDGKVARMLGVSSKFGAELDSLSDFVSFGVAPAVIMYQWTMNETARISVLTNAAEKAEAIGVHWAVVLFLAMCCATRLARFNTMLETKQPPYWTHFFMGVPAPAGGGLALFPLILWIATGKSIDFLRSPWFVSGFLIFSGAMMASRIPTPGMKHLHIPARWRSAVLILLFIVMAVFFVKPWSMLSTLGALYLITLPIGVVYFARERLKYRQHQGETK